MSFSCCCYPHARKSTTGRRNFEFIQFVHQQNGWIECRSIPRSPYERYSLCWRSTNTQHCAVWYRYCGLQHYRRACKTTVQNYKITVRLLRYNNQICYVNNINAVSQSFRCPNWVTFFYKTFNLKRQLTTCSERVKNVYPRNVYQFREILFDKLESFGIKYTTEQKLFKNLAVFNLIRAESKKSPPKIQIQQLGWGNTFRYLYQFHQILWKNQFSSATLIFITTLHFLLELSKI